MWYWRWNLVQLHARKVPCLPYNHFHSKADAFPLIRPQPDSLVWDKVTSGSQGSTIWELRLRESGFLNLNPDSATNCTTLTKLLTSVPLFLHLWNGNNNGTSLIPSLYGTVKICWADICGVMRIISSKHIFKDQISKCTDCLQCVAFDSAFFLSGCLSLHRGDGFSEEGQH